jgi:ABC-2 type transport system ATP-binding protein
MLADALRRLDGDGIRIDDVGLRRPTLDDVFLTLTGHTAEAEAEREPESRFEPEEVRP